MNVLSLILKEMLHRKINFLLSLLAVITAVGFFVAFSTTGAASQNETTRIQRDIGYNLRIIPKDADMDQFWSEGYCDATLSDDSVNRFTQQKGISYTHLLATLQRKIKWRDRTVLLTGIASEVSTEEKKKSPMIFEIDPGKAYVGFHLAQTLGLEPGNEIELEGKSFRVERALRESGSVDDIRIYTSLADAQEILKQPGRINEIKALECLCRDPNRESIEILREELERILPEAQVVKIEAIAKARESQRLMLEGYFALVMPIVIIVCAVWIGTLAMVNTRERKNEIGIMRALGYGSGRIAALFLGKAVVIGLIGAAFGFALGTWIAMTYGPGIFKITAKSLAPNYQLLWFALAAAPPFAALSSFIPAMVAVTDDPAVTLREE